jgi:hypothetical protein
VYGQKQLVPEQPDEQMYALSGTDGMQMGMAVYCWPGCSIRPLTTTAQNDQCDDFGYFLLIYFDVAHCRVVCPAHS